MTVRVAPELTEKFEWQSDAKHALTVRR